ncbi:MAG: 1,4-alpha-glucan branching protein GlgB [Lachnospiraceae bacterium]|nr:1,4-alpha-glucan branching protein GlgB [Lachnospiraceae bacterium]
MDKKLYKLMNWPAIEEIVFSESDNPHTLLGAHTAGNNTVVQTFQPGAEKVTLILKESGQKLKMDMADEEGYFAALVPGKKIGNYIYEVTDKEGNVKQVGDAYRFEPQITRQDTERFQAGIHYTVYEKLGAHPMTIDGTEGVSFAVWAPNALRVSTVGDFNGWDGRTHQMRRLWDSGIFEIFIPGVKPGDNYKFEIKVKGGLTYLKADPYAFRQQLRPETASVVASGEEFPWEDNDWLEKRKDFDAVTSPMSIYELYLGSFKKAEDGKDYDNYRDIAPALIKYVKEMGYTHVELMPIMEHPFDGSWGYQVIGYYAPTSRYGTPEDFRFLVNELHKAGIGVILDWVPAHFPRDTHGLSNFDGTCLYEHKDPRKGAHPHWGTLIYNYGRPEVSNYLIANALYWVEQFHADGIRMDAVASMLYLDYGKNDGEWIANMYGGNENLEAIEFIKHLNSIMHKRNQGVVTIAEESTAWPKITGDLEDDGLGFDIKWNMGWMNDFLGYMSYDPYFRAHHHGELTFSMIYNYSEKFMLVMSHDEVVHGKATLIGKMPGERQDKFNNLKAAYGFFFTHPGKKLLFMGQDIAEFDEWNENRSVKWEILDAPEHEGMRKLVKKLNELYVKYPSLHEWDHSSKGFEWLNCIASEQCMVAYMRKSQNREDTLLVVANFANVAQEFKLGVPYEGSYKEVLNTDAVEFGGEGRVNKRAILTEEEDYENKPFSLTVKSAPLSVSIFEYKKMTVETSKPTVKEKKTVAKKTTTKTAKATGTKTEKVTTAKVAKTTIKEDKKTATKNTKASTEKVDKTAVQKATKTTAAKTKKEVAK